MRKTRQGAESLLLGGFFYGLVGYHYLLDVALYLAKSAYIGIGSYHVGIVGYGYGLLLQRGLNLFGSFYESKCIFYLLLGYYLLFLGLIYCIFQSYICLLQFQVHLLHHIP